VEKAMSANKIHSSLLLQLFDNYLSTGGFPLPIIEFFLRGKISYKTRKVYIDLVKK
jgi:predicted AAA+ superfamily ATPase